MDNIAKLRPFYICKLLEEQTDEEHFLTTSQICNTLKENYGIDTYRKTIKSDIELLQSLGMEIAEVKSTQNKYALISRDFIVPELKLLIDAVESSKLITEKKAQELVSKLTSLASRNDAASLKQNLKVNRRYKAENEKVYYIIDAINSAINLKRKISFQMAEYNIKKQRVLHNKGEVYVFSPYSLVWDGDCYYVLGYSEKYQAITSHRIDRIYQSPTILNENIVEPPEGFDINQHINTMFNMFADERQEVTLICENDMMDKIIDKFGTDVQTYSCDMHSFKAIVNVATSPVFYSWVFTFGGKIRILAPEDVKQEFILLAKAAINI